MFAVVLNSIKQKEVGELMGALRLFKDKIWRNMEGVFFNNIGGGGGGGGGGEVEVR